ncbi:alpha/beta fold hydrolase [Microbacterium thalassium]|uniref:Pimeloyl-ACP methyl ester carboxylesterase n=1 Tax=Microbacterium thalassium TaxID=362649 RepID=A0A7X0KTA7_9MICO|nr:alpha/beta hydrolase [Microbacterium thalassium]MBB6389926.1 pimeloyl-ACP methyl ester carboxylesterase [Microbacterium thalassium]GLK24613.1 alpha/beta hydrolase [Microbacterium thalassium]
MPTVDNNGTSIYYEVHGAGSPVVFVHGSGGHHAAWWQQVVALRDTHTVVTLDLRGFGNSDSDETYDSLSFPGDIVAVLEDADLTDAVLVGQSIGAAAALKAALRVPERIRGVILAHSLGGIDAPEVTPLVKADRAEAEKLPVIDRLLTKEFRAEQPAKTFLFTQQGTFNKARMQDLRNLATDGPTVADLEAVGVRVAFLAGEKDAVISPATVTKAHELVAGSLLEIVPGAPHSMYWEAPELFNTAVAKLVDALERVEVLERN